MSDTKNLIDIIFPQFNEISEVQRSFKGRSLTSKKGILIPKEIQKVIISSGEKRFSKIERELNFIC